MLQQRHAARDAERAALAAEDEKRRKAALYLGATSAGFAATAANDLRSGALRADQDAARTARIAADAAKAVLVAASLRQTCATYASTTEHTMAMHSAQRVLQQSEPLITYMRAALL
eukprot:11220-Heterococcus_DN1.PRE.4